MSIRKDKFIYESINYIKERYFMEVHYYHDGVYLAISEYIENKEGHEGSPLVEVEGSRDIFEAITKVLAWIKKEEEIDV